MERSKYVEKRRDSEYKDKLDDKYKQNAYQRNNTSKDMLTKNSRSFADDIAIVGQSSELLRQHRHRHHHRQHRHHHSSHSQRRHHRRRHEQLQASDVIDLAEEEKPTVNATTTPPALLESPAISVSSSNSSLSTNHYSHSPAVVVDNELPHDHNNEQSSPGKYKNRYSKRSRSTTPISSKRSRSDSLESGADTDNKTETPRSSVERSNNSSSSRDSDSTSRSSQPNEHSETVAAVHLEEAIEAAKPETIEEAAEVLLPIETVNGAVKNETLPDYYPGVQGCRSVEEFQCLNRIEEGTYGVVYRAKDKKTNELVALKRLKMEKETEGFPITSLREINTLLKGQHPNIVTVREIVVGSNMDQIFIVMDYVEHDMKSLMQTMKQRKQSFLPSEVKCLTQQLLRAVAHLHDNWILHRDLKTSNLLLSHKGILKVADFGLAREYGSPLKHYTPVVVTLWYRAPELLLCSPEYSTPVDMWSVGCIFAEWLHMRPLFTGETEIDQLNRIYKELGTPNEKIWPGYNQLPAVKNMISQNSQFTEYPISSLRKRFVNTTTELGINLLQGLLTYDPEKRLTAEKAMQHEYFKELPLPVDPSMFPTWPAKSELGERKKVASPKPPPGGTQFKQLAGLDGAYTKGAGFQLRF